MTSCCGISAFSVRKEIPHQLYVRKAKGHGYTLSEKPGKFDEVK